MQEIVRVHNGAKPFTGKKKHVLGLPTGDGLLHLMNKGRAVLKCPLSLFTTIRRDLEGAASHCVVLEGC